MTYLLLGKERFLKEEFLRKLKATLFGADAALNTQEFSGGRAGAAPDFLAFCRTAPFLSEKKLAIFHDGDVLNADEKKLLAEALDSFPSFCDAVFLSDQSRPGKDAFLTALSARSKSLVFHPPFERELPAWIQTRAKSLGVAMEPGTPAALLERVGRDLASLASSLEKLTVYVHPRKRLEVSDIVGLFGKSAHEDVFAVWDDVLAGRTSGAIRTVRGLLRENVRPAEIFGVLVSQWEKLAGMAAALRRGDAAERVTSEAKVHPYFAERWLQKAGRLAQAREAERAVWKELWRLDEVLKTGAVQEAACLEIFLMRAAGCLAGKG